MSLCFTSPLTFLHSQSKSVLRNVSHAILFSFCSISVAAPLHAAAHASSESCDITEYFLRRACKFQ